MEKLREILKQPDTVLFIGSGLSLWSGLPSWTKLIAELAKFLADNGHSAELVLSELSKGDLLQAASYGFDKLTKPQIGDFIRQACQYGVAKPHQIHKKVVSLGPRCFITTNYDNLLEESLRLWRTELFFRPPITNRHLTGTAEIVHARATDFVFKPHGDAGDSDSIILTREQYRELLPGGEKQAILESVKLLLASRPVVYIGFGLRDPDFLYMKDLLANTYKGGGRDHYAIMADIAEAEKDYWRRHYGIQLISYSTSEEPDGSRGHAGLDQLLHQLTIHPKSMVSLSSDKDTDPRVVLALARHAGRLSLAPKAEPEFPVRVHTYEKVSKKNNLNQRQKFQHWPVEKFLDQTQQRVILIGAPGAGKSYSMRRAALRLAERLNKCCLEDSFKQSSIEVPVFADLKLYAGDLYDLVSKTLSSDLVLDELVAKFKVKIFLDSFNEMPREHWENSAYETDFVGFFDRFQAASVVIGSRTDDGLEKLSLPIYHLDEIDEAFVAQELDRLDIRINNRFASEVKELLQKPFYFSLVARRVVTLNDEPHPRDFYFSIFDQLEQAFFLKFETKISLVDALSLAAYNAINTGEEAQSLDGFLRSIEMRVSGLPKLKALEIANWLVSRSILVPYSGSRVAFFHQSATEYLAARELATRFESDASLLQEKLALTRWDQALFLALSVMPYKNGEIFLKAIIETDFGLAMRAVKYLETGRDAVVSRLLEEFPRRRRGLGRFEGNLDWMLQDIPISLGHEAALRRILAMGDISGGMAAKQLVVLKGQSIKNEMLELLVSHKDDYNFCANGVGPALQPLAEVEDILKILLLSEGIKHEVKASSPDDVVHGFISGAAEVLGTLDIELVRDYFVPDNASVRISEINARLLCDLLWDQRTTGALRVAGDLLLLGHTRATIAIYFISTYSDKETPLSWDSFSEEHVALLLKQISDPSDNSWALRAMRLLCMNRPNLCGLVERASANESGLLKAMLLYCIHGESQIIFEALTKLANSNLSQIDAEPLYLVEQIDLDWIGREAQLGNLLRLRHIGIAKVVIEPLHSFDGMKEIDFDSAKWWMEWLSEIILMNPQSLLPDRLGRLLIECSSHSFRAELLAEFNNPISKYRELLTDSVLCRSTDISTDDFSEFAISYLLRELGSSNFSKGWRESLLSLTATEEFVQTRLLPLLLTGDSALVKNLQSTLRQVGLRHGRRYVVT